MCHVTQAHNKGPFDHPTLRPVMTFTQTFILWKWEDDRYGPSMPHSLSRKIYGSGLAPEDLPSSRTTNRVRNWIISMSTGCMANRTPCWYFTDLTNSSGKVTDRTIALNKESRCSSAAHETFKSGFEHKIAMKPMPRREENLHGKRKYSDPSGQTSTQQFDPSGNYSARDLQKLNATFADQSETKSAATVPTHTTSKVTMWRHGEVRTCSRAISRPYDSHLSQRRDGFKLSP